MEKNKKTVTLVTYFPSHIGGLYSHMISLNDALLKKGIHVNLIFNNQNKYVNRIIQGYFIIKNIFNISKAKIDFTKYKLDKLEIELKKYEHVTDVFHFHDVLSSSLLPHKKNKLLTVHGPLSKEGKMLNPQYPLYVDFLKEFEYNYYQKLSHIVAVDTGQKQILVDEYNIPENRITVMFNSVNTDLFKPSNNCAEENYLLVPRRFVKKNGVEIAVRAMSFLKDYDIKMFLVGAGPEEKNISEVINILSLHDKVKNLGPKNHNELIPLIQNSKFLIVPSIPDNGVVEATSISALEGMACGKIVIGSNIGGIAEIIQDGYNGFLFEYGDSKALADKIINVLSIDTQGEIERNARVDILENYSHNKSVESLLKIYSLI